MKIRGNRFDIQYKPDTILKQFSFLAYKYGISNRKASFFVMPNNSNMKRVKITDKSTIKHLLRKLKNGSIPYIKLSRCNADVIKISNNIVGFYPDHQRIIKVFADKETYHRSIEGLQTFVHTNPSAFETPRIIAHAEEPVPHKMEPLYRGKKIDLPLSFTSEELRDLATFHFHNSDIVEFSFSEDEKTTIRENLRKIHLSARIETKLDDLLNRSSHRLVYGTLHGDLSPSNIIQQANSRIIIDWEQYKHGFIAEDLRRLWLYSDSDTRKKIIQVYNQVQQKRFTGKPSVLPDSFQHAIMISILIRFISLYTTSFDYALRRTANQAKSLEVIKNREKNFKKGFLFLTDHYFQ